MDIIDKRSTEMSSFTFSLGKGKGNIVLEPNEAGDGYKVQITDEMVAAASENIVMYTGDIIICPEFIKVVKFSLQKILGGNNAG